jgi:uncharacterized C2H2 Zn-finger protein
VALPRVRAFLFFSEFFVANGAVPIAGRPKKAFVCKVPGCSKLFKRSEHLKRHVRSLHTDEKRKSKAWYAAENGS